MNRQLDGLSFGDQAPTEPMLRAWGWGCADLRTAVNNWKNINTTELVTFNAVLAKSGLQPIKAATQTLAVPGCAVTTNGKH
jgi:hypothetical protein